MIGARDLPRRGFLSAAALALLTGRSRGDGPPPALADRRVFPADDPWNVDISKRPVDSASATLVRSIGVDKPLHADFGPEYQGRPIGIPYVVVPGDQPRVPVRFEYAAESDPGPYPIPDDAPIEGGPDAKGDRHVLVIDKDNWKLYELFDAHKEPGGGWRAGSGAIFDLKTNTTRPAGWTSADAAGLPIFPGLARFDEATSKAGIRHALRFTCVRSRHAYIPPARHFASKLTDPGLPPMGLRARLKASVAIDAYPPQARAVLRALKTYGMILADNGSDWFVTGTPDPRWDAEELGTLRRIKGRDLEVVAMGRAVDR